MRWINLFTNIAVLGIINILTMKEYLELMLIILSIFVTIVNLTINIKKITFKDKTK